jgi:hypothetical protein
MATAAPGLAGRCGGQGSRPSGGPEKMGDTTTSTTSNSSTSTANTASTARTSNTTPSNTTSVVPVTSEEPARSSARARPQGHSAHRACG